MARGFGAGVAILGALLLANQVVTADAQQDFLLANKAQERIHN